MNHENDPFEDFRRKRELREEARTREKQTRLAQQIFADENRAEYVDRHVHDEMQDFFDESSRKAAKFLRGIQSTHEAKRRQKIESEAEDFLSMSRQQTESLLSHLSEEDLGALSSDPSESGASFPRLEPASESGSPIPRIDPPPQEDSPEASESMGKDDVPRASLADSICHQETIGPVTEGESSPRFGLPEFDVGLEEEEEASGIEAKASTEQLDALRAENRELMDQVESLQKRLEVLTSVLVEKQTITWEDLESEVIPL